VGLKSLKSLNLTNVYPNNNNNNKKNNNKKNNNNNNKKNNKVKSKPLELRSRVKTKSDHCPATGVCVICFLEHRISGIYFIKKLEKGKIAPGASGSQCALALARVYQRASISARASTCNAQRGSPSVRA
jgi:hypothetical protein